MSCRRGRGLGSPRSRLYLARLSSYQESHGSPILPIFRVADGKMPALKSGEKLPPFSPKGPVWRAESIKPVKP